MTGGTRGGAFAWARANWLRLLVHLGALLPLPVWLYRYLTGYFFIDPVSETIRLTGRLAIAFLFLSLSCTPLAVLTGYRRILRVRRPLGLYALLYAALHFLAYALWDYRFDLDLLWEAVLYQQFVIAGFAALLILVALGITSLRGLRIRMGRRWRWFQRSVYVAGALAVLHILWQVKNFWEAWRYPVILTILLVFRIPYVQRAIAKARQAVLKPRSRGSRE